MCMRIILAVVHERITIESTGTPNNKEIGYINCNVSIISDSWVRDRTETLGKAKPHKTQEWYRKKTLEVSSFSLYI